MKASFRYDARLDPPGPVLPLRLAPPGAEHGVVFTVLVDTGADCTLVPERTAHALGLPAIDQVWIEELGGAARRATVCAARVEFAGVRLLARVVAHGVEAILGRDLLNHAIALFDGPALRLSVRRPNSLPLRSKGKARNPGRCAQP